MNSFVALLRGINVSGKNRIKMTDLVSALKGLDLQNLETHLQSGNLVFIKIGSDARELRAAIEKRIKSELSLEVAALVKNGADMAEAISGNPYLKENGIDIERLYITFLFEEPIPTKVKLIEGLKDPTDSFRLIDDVVYLHCPGGYGNTKFSNTFFEKKLAVEATTRNWRTVNALSEMAAKAPGK